MTKLVGAGALRSPGVQVNWPPGRASMARRRTGASGLRLERGRLAFVGISGRGGKTQQRFVLQRFGCR